MWGFATRMKKPRSDRTAASRILFRRVSRGGKSSCHPQHRIIAILAEDYLIGLHCFVLGIIALGLVGESRFNRLTREVHPVSLSDAIMG